MYCDAMPASGLGRRQLTNFHKSRNLMTVRLTLLCLLLALGLHRASAQCGTEISCAGHAITCLEPTVSFGCVVTGNAPFTFAWLDGNNTLISTDSVLTTDMPGTYTLVVTDNGGCEESAQVVVVEDVEVPNCNLPGQIMLFCEGEEIILSAEQCFPIPATYAWSDGSTTPDILVSSAGVYCVTVTSANGCIVEHCITVEEVPAMVLDVTVTDVSCFGQADGSAIISISGGTPPYAYQWAGPGGPFPFPQVINLSGGTYSVTVTDSNGCTATANFTIQEPAPFDADAVILQSPQCNSTNDGIIEIIVTGGEPPYTYTWGNGLPGPTLSGLSPGIYSITVTDVNGCSNIITVELEPLVRADAGPDQVLSCFDFPWSATLDGSNSATGPTISYTWTGPNGFTSNLPVVDVINDGIYQLEVVDNSIPGCSDIDEVEVTFDDFFHSVLYDPVACDSAILSFNVANPALEGGWILPDGDTTEVNPYYALASGTYTLLLYNPETGCVNENEFDVVVDPAGCATIKGRLVRDTMPDCVPTPEEPGLQNWLMVIEGNGEMAYAVTQADGSYEQRVLPGDYEVYPILPGALWLACEDSFPASVPEAGDTAMLDIPVLEQEPCPSLSIDFAMPILRRCWTRSFFFNYCNNGTAAAEDAYVVLTLDDFFTYQSANVPLIAQDGNQYTFSLGDIAINQCGAFLVDVVVACDAQIGQSLCVEAKIFPNAPCFPPLPGWSGASLRVSGQCAGDEVRFRVENAGAGDMLESSRCIIIEDAVMLMALPDTVLLRSGEFFEYNLPANGSTYRIEVEQAPFHPGSSMPSAVIEGCGANNQGSFSTGFVNQFPLDDASPFIDIECGEIVAAIDPNDKQGFPRGYGDEHYIYPGTDIEYLVRFQNTGNDTAFLVVIRDTLSEHLDITTVRPGTASHPYTWDIDSTNILVFTFENILLPDSTTNLEGSQGFLEFRVSQKDSLPLGAVIENSAAIYFDINEPVITNTTFHTLGRDFVELVGIRPDPGIPGVTVEVIPNPAGAWALFRLQGWPGGPGLFELMDGQGQVVQQRRFSDVQFRFERGGLPAGLYVFRIRDEKGRWMAGKVVLK